MGSYYRDPNLSFQQERSSPAFSQPVASSSNQHSPDHDSSDQAQRSSSTRYCSVRGCTSVLPLNYGNKMCDVCRGRHRIYASTKRAKRKMEKAALGLQHGWNPGDEDAQDTGASSSSAANVLAGQETTTSEQAAQPFMYSGSTSWDTALDPRLFHPVASSSSELAGALTLPPRAASRSRSPGHPHVSALHPSSRISPETGCPDASGSAPYTPFQQPRVPTPQQQKGEISVQSISEVAAIQPDGSLPPRFCSIKGCKTVMDGNSLFKMCDTCRSKYKTYGNTKRKKWKEEKAKAIAEMERQREEQNRIRAEQGLAPLPAVNTLAWAEDTVVGRAVNTSIPRMCTVSHCREILPVGYEYLRCERHRIQNRHHSKLKRVRDKDAKAQALEGWFATLSSPGASSSQLVYQATQGYKLSETSPFDEDPNGEKSLEVSIGDVLSTEEQTRAPSLNLNVSAAEPQVIIFGVPPAARGVRRTNHVCTIKGCHNLLSPSAPWKMCDDCRAHERTVRKVRALRESGVPVDPVPPRMPPRERKEKQTKEKKTKSGKKDGSSGEHSSHSESPELNEDEGDGSGLIFMDPVLLDEETDAPEPILRVNTKISFVMADQEGNISEPPNSRPQPPPPEPVVAPPLPSTPLVLPATSESALSSVVSKKKASKKKAANQSPNTTTVVPSVVETAHPEPSGSNAPSVTSPEVQPLPTAETPAPASALLSPSPYGLPYYMPPPGYGLPYPPPGAPYPYPPPPPHHLPPAFPRDSFAPSPMYQPPFPGFPGYPSPYPPPYGYYPPPYPYPPPPPHAAASVQPALPQSQESRTRPVTAGPSASLTPLSNASATPATYNAGATTYVTAASNNVTSAAASSQPCSSWAPPPPPPDPSSMYSMFPVRLNDASRSADGSATAGAPSAPATIITTTLSAGEKHKQTEMIFVDKPPEKRKRRKADMAAVEAYLKRREEEKTRAEMGAAQNNTHSAPSDGVAQNDSSATTTVQLVSQIIPTPTEAPPAAPADTDASQPPQRTRPCGNKLCNRSLAPRDNGTICTRCKDKMKKRAFKMKKRFKLVQPSSIVPSKLRAKMGPAQQETTSHGHGRGDEAEDADETSQQQ